MPGKVVPVQPRLRRRAARGYRLTSRGYTIRHTETWHRDGVSQSFVVWDPPEITEADLPY